MVPPPPTTMTLVVCRHVAILQQDSWRTLSRLLTFELDFQRRTTFQRHAYDWITASEPPVRVRCCWSSRVYLVDTWSIVKCEVDFPTQLAPRMIIRHWNSSRPPHRIYIWTAIYLWIVPRPAIPQFGKRSERSTQLPLPHVRIYRLVVRCNMMGSTYERPV